MIVTVLIVLSMAWLQLGLTKNKEHQNSADTKRAFYIAEAGLSEAFAGLVAGRSGNVGGPGLPARFANGLFWVTAREESDGKVSLTSTGMVGSGRVALSMVLENAAETVASKGAFGDQSVTVMGGARIDAFDSRGGGSSAQMIDPDAPQTGARVGSNQDILVLDPPPTMLGAKTEIFGDARPGPRRAVIRGSNSTITGSTAPSDEMVTLPSITVPSIPSNGNIDYSLTTSPLTLPTGSTAFGTLRVRNGAKVIVQGPTTLVVNSLQVDSNAELVLDSTAGPIQLFVRDYIYFATTSRLRTPERVPNRVSIQTTASKTIDRDGDLIPDPPVRFQVTSNVYATIYAPLASVSIPASMDLFGAITALQLTVQQSARIHFDRALTVATRQNGGQPRFAGWRIVELPSSPLISMRYDPLMVVRESGMLPPPAPNAHYDVGVSPPMTITQPLQFP
jgi:hypothetical protein